jgi:hypothetical protein
MHPQFVLNILDRGKDAAYHKIITDIDNGLITIDPRLLSFSDLQMLLEHKAVDLGDKIFNVIKPSPLTEEALNAICDKASDVIGLASGIVAKCTQELDKIRLADEKSLFDDDN